MAVEEDKSINYNWMSFDDNSFLQDSNLDIHNESNFSSMGLKTCGLADLSCSLLHSDAGDGDGISSANMDVERLVNALIKRDNLISSLVTSLDIMLRNREDGDNMLTSVEKQVESLQIELSKSRGLLFTLPVGSAIECKSDKKALNCKLVSVSTQTKVTSPENSVFKQNAENQCNLSNEEQQVVQSKIIKSRSVATSVSPKSECRIIDSSSIELNHETSVNVGNQLNNSFEEDYNDDGSPHKLIFPPINPDSLRLTFSPSICEYEAEAHNFHKSTECSFAVIDDLKLQISDTERKLESTKKYLEEMTVEREQEREDFQRTINNLVVRYEETKKERDKAEEIKLRQKQEIDDMEESQRRNQQFQDDLVKKFTSTEYELKRAVEKIDELREIIRALEEQVEEATREAMMLSDARKGINEESIAEESRDSCSEIQKPLNDGCTSDLDYTEELQAQVYELAKKIEEKLVELENFPWQARPSSSCSVKSGDDVSVRAAVRIQSNDSAAATLDFVSQVFCGLRRLECSFDSLVRFEEVLLKKIRDAELKIVIENKRQENLNTENTKLRKELIACRQKIMDFENFLRETKKSHTTVFTPSVEALRTVVHNVSRQFEESSVQFLRRDIIKDQLDKGDGNESDGMADTDVDEYEASEEFGFGESENNLKNPSTNSNNSKNPNNGALENGENQLPSEYRDQDGDESMNEMSEDEKDYPVITQNGQRNGSGQSSDNSRNPDTNRSKDGFQNTPERLRSSLHGLVLETNLDPDYFASSSPNNKTRNSKTNSTISIRRSGDKNESGNNSQRHNENEDDPESDFRNQSDDEDGEMFKDLDNPDEGRKKSSEGQRDADNSETEHNNDDVVTYDVTTVSDYEVDGDNLKYIGSKIIPSEDPTDPDAQNTRLKGTDSQVELEKVKTQLDQLQKALQAEKNRSQELSNQLNEILHGPDDENGPSSSTGDGISPEEHISILRRSIQEKDQEKCRLNRTIQCARATYEQLQEENLEQRAYIKELENDLEDYFLQQQSER